MAVVKVTLVTNGGKKNDIVPDTMTLRQIYEKNDVNYASCTNTVDSVPVRIGDLDKSLHELGCGETVRISSIVKMDNANDPQVTIAGSAAVVRSGYKLDQWKRALKFEPELAIYDDNDEKVFAAFVEDGPGSLTSDGVVFSSVPDQNGYAVATLILDPTEEDKETMVKDKIGLGLINLKQMEKSLEEVITAAEQYEQEINEMVKTI